MKYNTNEQVEYQQDPRDEAWFVDPDDDELLSAGEAGTPLALWVMLALGLACYGVLVAALLR